MDSPGYGLSGHQASGVMRYGLEAVQYTKKWVLTSKSLAKSRKNFRENPKFFRSLYPGRPGGYSVDMDHIVVWGTVASLTLGTKGG